MEKLHTQGLITHALTFKEYDRIITLFTPNDGLIKVVIKGAFSQKQSQGATTTPLTRIELNCVRRQSELYSGSDIEVVDSNFALRSNLKTLESACDMLQTVTATQQPGKAAPDLYKLLGVYLQRLPQAEYPSTVAASFKLKLLRHEGLLELPSMPTTTFPKEVHDLVLALAFSLDFGLIASLELTKEAAAKITSLYESALR